MVGGWSVGAPAAELAELDEEPADPNADESVGGTSAACDLAPLDGADWLDVALLDSAELGPGDRSPTARLAAADPDAAEPALLAAEVAVAATAPDAADDDAPDDAPCPPLPATTDDRHDQRHSRGERAGALPEARPGAALERARA